MQIFFVSIVRFFLICIRHNIIKGALPVYLRNAPFLL